jgi:hypothetical protein
VAEKKVTIKMNKKKLNDQIEKIKQIVIDCDLSRDDIDVKSDEYGNPSRDADTFYYDVAPELKRVEDRARWITDRMNRIIQINESGIGKRDKTTGVISIDVPESVDKKGISGFDAWSQGVLDSQTLVKYSEEGCTPEQYDALLARMERYQSDPSYAAAVFDEIGPGRLLDLPLDIEGHFMQGTDGGTVSLRESAGSDLASVLGHLLATRSQSWDDNEAKNYADRLTHYAEEKNKGSRVESLNAMLSASRGQDVDGDGGNEVVGLNYNDAFLLELARKIENFKPKGGYDGRGGVHSAANELEGVVHAMTGNPDAAEQWLTVRTSDGKVDTGKTAERTQSLIQKATSNGWVIAGTWTDQWEEDWLMLAAEHAVRGTEDPVGGPQHAAVTSAVLNTIGENAEHKSWSGSDYMTLTERGRNAASIALASYPYAVQKTASSRSGVEKGWVSEQDGNSWARGKNAQGKNYQPVIHSNALKSLLGEVGQDDAAVARYVSSQELFNKVQLDAAISGGEDSNKVKDILNDQAAARGFTSGSIVRQSDLIDADTNARVGAFAEVTGMAINAIPLPQAKAGGAALSAGTKFAMNYGKAAASNAAKAGINGLYGKGADTEEIKSNGRQANVEFQTLSVLQTAYTQDERKRILMTNSGTSLSSIIGPNGELKVDPNLVNPYGDGNADNKSNKSDKDIHGLTSEQRQALEHLSGQLPQDEKDADPKTGAPAMRDHEAMSNFEKDRSDSYDNGFNNATK